MPIRYGRMLASPFAFFRGGAAIMAADLAATPDSGLRAQLCGDAHLSNFGGFASPDRDLVFDVNDFDETLPGPWEWDLKRLAASIEIAGRVSFGPARVRSQVLAAVREYRRAMREFAEMGNLELWSARLDTAAVRMRWGDSVSSKGRQRAERRAVKARSKDHMRKLIAAYARTLSGSARTLLGEYEYVDLAQKVVGVGSVGTRALIVLLVGRDDSDPLFLQVKEAQPSVLEAHLRPSRFRSHGRRVVEGQWLMQAAGDIFLGWLSAEGVDGVKRDFYVRQLWTGSSRLWSRR